MLALMNDDTKLNFARPMSWAPFAMAGRVKITGPDDCF
jgi:hypothetical protein